MSPRPDSHADSYPCKQLYVAVVASGWQTVLEQGSSRASTRSWAKAIFATGLADWCCTTGGQMAVHQWHLHASHWDNASLPNGTELLALFDFLRADAHHELCPHFTGAICLTNFVELQNLSEREPSQPAAHHALRMHGL